VVKLVGDTHRYARKIGGVVGRQSVVAKVPEQNEQARSQKDGIYHQVMRFLFLVPGFWGYVIEVQCRHRSSIFAIRPNCISLDRGVLGSRRIVVPDTQDVLS